MEKRKKIIAIIAIIIIAAVTVWVWRTYYQPRKEAIEATGTIEATSVDLQAKLAGTIKILLVKAGDQVKEGQLVAELSRNDLLAQRERDELSVVKAETALNDLESGARSQEISEAEANVNIARVNLQRAADDLEKTNALVEAGAIPVVEYEKVQTAWEICSNQLQAAESRLNLLLSGSREQAIKAARLEVERNKAILKATEALLEDLKIYSPVDGVVMAKNFQAGEYVQPGQALATVINLDDLWIKVYIATDDLPQVVLGKEVTFTVSGLSRSFKGVVEEIATKGEFTPRTIQTKKERTNVVFAVKIRINNEGGVLKPGMPADVVFLRR
jgi:HlyD family secretion protein